MMGNHRLGSTNMPAATVPDSSYNWPLYNIEAAAANSIAHVAPSFLDLPGLNAVPDLQQQFSADSIFPNVNQINQYSVYPPIHSATAFNDSYANEHQNNVK